LQLAKGGVVGVNPVTPGEGIVDLGLGEAIGAVWLQLDVALYDGDAGDSVGRVSGDVVLGVQSGDGEQKYAQNAGKPAVAEAGRDGKVCDVRVGHDVLLGGLETTFMACFAFLVYVGRQGREAPCWLEPGCRRKDVAR
jgi:hypothetical protein